MTRDPMETCGAKTRAGTPCAKTPGWGTEYPGIGRCKLHGGASPGANRGAQLELARRAVTTLGLPRDVAPHVALQEELNRAAGAVAWLTMKVHELGEHEVSGPVGGGPGSHPRYEPNVLIRMLNEERDRLARVAKTCIDVGVEERRVRVAEEQGAYVAAVLRGVLADLNISLDNPETERAVRRHLSAVDDD